MYLEAVLVCVNYSDILQITLPRNLNFFDRINVITHNNDNETIKLCKKYNVDITITDRMYENKKDDFNKGKALNEGIKELTKQDWLVIIDADMTFSNNLRDELKNNIKDKNKIYGIPRYLCKTHEEWNKYLIDESIISSWPCQKRKSIGVGYFQMTNFNNEIMKEMTKNNLWYSEGWGHCGRSDRYFYRSWPDDLRSSISNVYGIHLGDDSFQANWRGRTTRLFN